MYKDMTEILEDRKIGDFAISKFEITENDFRAIYRDGIPVGKYVWLTHNSECVMSNTPMEKRTNREFVCNAHGNVLIGGLGIGLIILAIQEKEEVSHITIVEKNKEVIDLVADQLPLNEKVEIVNADIFEYVPTEKYNTIYIDIWNWVDSDIYREEMKPLIQRYRKHLVKKSEDENRYIDCWCKRQAKNDTEI